MKQWTLGCTVSQMQVVQPAQTSVEILVVVVWDEGVGVGCISYVGVWACSGCCWELVVRGEGGGMSCISYAGGGACFGCFWEFVVRDGAGKAVCISYAGGGACLRSVSVALKSNCCVVCCWAVCRCAYIFSCRTFCCWELFVTVVVLGTAGCAVVLLRMMQTMMIQMVGMITNSTKDAIDTPTTAQTVPISRKRWNYLKSAN